MAKSHEWVCPNCNTKAVFTLPKPASAQKAPPTLRSAWRDFSKRNPILTFGILGASLISIGSGVYLYIEGQNLWLQAKAQLKTPVLSVPQEPVEVAQAHVADAVTKVATAPERPALTVPTPAPNQVQLKIKARSGYANFRSGPGMDFPVIGITRGNQSYPVVDWKDRWLKVLTKPATAAAPADTAWVRSDMTAPSAN